MSPQDRLEFEKMKRDIQAIRNCTDTVFIAELRRRLAGIQVVIEDGASTSGTNIAVGNVPNTGSELVANNYTGVASLYLNGVLLGKIGYY